MLVVLLEGRQTTGGLASVKLPPVQTDYSVWRNMNIANLQAFRSCHTLRREYCRVVKSKNFVYYTVENWLWGAATVGFF